MNADPMIVRFRIAPIRADFLSRARQNGLDDLDQPVEWLTAAGGEPCRDALRPAHSGESLILASYCPFTQSGPYREFGPVFILAALEPEPPSSTALDFKDLVNIGYLSETFVLRAYSKLERIIDARLCSLSQAPDTLNDFFSSDEIHFVLARFAAHGCYAFRIERSTANYD